LNQYFKNIHRVLIFSLVLTLSSCLNFSGDGGNSSPSIVKSTNTKDILETFKGGTIDIRDHRVFKVNDSSSKEKLVKTQITILGEGRVILLSNKAFAFKGEGQKVFSNSNDFKFLVVEEFYNGNIIKTKLNGDIKNITYRLRL